MSIYLVVLDICGNGNHNHKHFLNHLDLFGIFIFGNMEKINVTRGFPGISFLHTDKRSMAFLNIGISGLALKSHVQVGDELLMY